MTHMVAQLMMGFGQAAKFLSQYFGPLLTVDASWVISLARWAAVSAAFMARSAASSLNLADPHDSTSLDLRYLLGSFCF